MVVQLASIHRARQIVAAADRLLAQAREMEDPAESMSAGYLAALRASGAVLAIAELRLPHSRAARDAWSRMSRCSPDFAHWSHYFAGYSATRAAIDAGCHRPIDAATAQDFLSQVIDFVTDVDELVVSYQHEQETRRDVGPVTSRRSA